MIGGFTVKKCHGFIFLKSRSSNVKSGNLPINWKPQIQATMLGLARPPTRRKTLRCWSESREVNGVDEEHLRGLRLEKRRLAENLLLSTMTREEGAAREGGQGLLLLFCFQHKTTDSGLFPQK